MGSLMQCLLRSCLERDIDDAEEHDNTEDDSYQPPRPTLPARMARSFPYTETSMNEDEDEQDDCCHPDAANPSAPTHTDEQSALHAFWKNLRASWRHYDSLESPPPPPLNQKGPEQLLHSPSSTISNSPLRTASSFDDSSGLFPAINPEEIVLPGSALQKLMASKMSESMEDMGDECVICMEGFSQDNPRMPTLCGCGENKTYFHLPCLYQWMEQNKNCPSCRKRLRWEEF